MKVRELIEALKEYPKDMRVIIKGYEGGYWDAGRLEKLKIHLFVNMNDLDLFGPHDDADMHKDRSYDVEVLLIRGQMET